jgi:hypothetical protein
MRGDNEGFQLSMGEKRIRVVGAAARQMTATTALQRSDCANVQALSTHGGRS